MISAWRKLTSLVSSSALLIGLLVAIPISFTWPSSASAVNPTCSSSMTAQGAGLKAVPAHGQVFYIDSGVTPKVDAAYIGYRIQNSSGSTMTGLWVSVDNFVGGKVSLANPLDQYQQMDPITTANYKTAFYLIKASGPTSTAQTHTVKVFNKRPDLSGATALLTCDFTFSQIQETIKASANKVNTVAGVLSPSTATLGGSLTVTVTGATGKVGAGKAPDYSIIWVSPAAVSTWPTRSLRLESTSIVLNCSNPKPSITLVDTLIQSTADTSCFSNSDTWTGTYVFRIIGPGPSSLTPSPIADIASGTQYKHSDITGLAFSSAINLSGVASSSFTVNVTASSTVVSSTSSSARIRYTVTLTTTSTTAVEVDEIIDRPASGTTYITGSATLNGASTSDPSYLASESSLSPPPPHFIGPFSVVSGTPVVITYVRELPCSSTPTDYSNTVYAKTGDQILGQSATTVPGVTVRTTSGVTTCSATVTDNPQTIAPTTQTSPATSVTSSSATLNGYSNAYGGASVTTYFKYSTDKNLVSGVTTTTAQSLTGSSLSPITQAISGLTSGTVYYFQIVITSPTTPTTYGAILNFTTNAVQAVPTVITSAATAVQSTIATLNGSLNPNLTAITGVQFIYAQSSALPADVSTTATGSNGQFTISVASATGIYVGMTATSTKVGAGAVVTAISGTTVTLSVANTGTVNTTVTFSGTTTTAVQMDDGSGTLVPMTLSGSGATTVFLDITGLSSGVKYYFKARGTCIVNVTYCPNGYVDGAILNFTTGAPNVVTNPATSVADVSATINGNVQQASNSDTWNFIYCAYDVSTCNENGITSGTSTTATSRGNTTAANVSANLTGLTSGTVYYFQVLGYTTASASPVSYGAVLSFETLKITTGTTLTSGSQGTIYSASVAGSGGSGSYNWSATSGLPSGLSISSSGLISGTPTSAGTYNSVVLRMYDPFYDTYTEKTFTIVIGAQTFTVTFRSNYGVETTSTQSANTTTNLTSNTFTRTGYSFAGWNTLANPSGGGTSYTDGASYAFTADLTLYAQWTADQYIVTYDPNGSGSSVSPTSATYTYGGTALTLPTPTRTGYTFTNWYTLSSGGSVVNSPFTPTGATTIYAHWTADQYTITYNKNCTAASVTPTSATFTVGGTALTPPTPTGCTGYTFAGWYTLSSGGSSIPTSYSPTSSGTIYAQWTVNQYTVTFDANTGVYANASTSKTASLDYNSNALTQVPESPTKTGNTLLGWSTSSTATSALSSYSVPASNVTLYAVWSVNSYVITFDAATNGGAFASGNANTQTVSVNFGLDAIPFAPSNPAKASNTFIGWNTNSAATTALTSYQVGAATATLYAIYVSGPVLFTVTFNGNSPTSGSPGTSSATQASDGASITLSTAGNLAKTHYTFGGWNLTGSGTPISGSTYTPTSNVTLYAIWTPDSYTVTYVATTGGIVKLSGGSGVSSLNQTVVYLGDAAAVTAQADTGYEFTGWTDSAAIGATRTDLGVTSSVTYTANFSRINYVVTYTAGTGGSITGTSSQTIAYGSNGSAVTATPSTGYRFVRWSDNSTTNPRTDNTVTSSQTFNAVFELLTYTVTYVPGSRGALTGTAVQTVSHGSDGSSVTIAANSGYTFSKWSEDNSTSTTRNETNVTSNLTFTAIYAVNNYVITFDTNGGVYSDSSTSKNVTLAFNVDALLSVPATPTYTGYTLLGWAATAGAASALATYLVPAQNKTLYAVWSADTVYTITYLTTGSESGSAPSSTTGSGTVTLRSNSGSLAKSGYTLSSWNTSANCGGTAYSIGGSYNLTSSVTLYPCFVANSAPTPTPVYVPTPPTITKISAAEVCSIGSQLVITGTYLTDARATVAGVSAVVISSRFSEMTISLPTHPVGTKTIVVTNIDGSANANVEYKFVDSPIYVNFIYPSTYQGQAFTYTFTATNTEKYSVEGVMPAGLTLNPLTGEISGTPTEAGNYLFTIVASNLCDQTYLDVYMFVDKAIPQTYTCTVPFLSLIHI